MATLLSPVEHFHAYCAEAVATETPVIEIVRVDGEAWPIYAEPLPLSDAMTEYEDMALEALMESPSYLF